MNDIENVPACIEMVIDGLKCCFLPQGDCDNCPYKEVGYVSECTSSLAKDALELLKEQQERIKTLESLRRIEQEGR